jgi:hypothetical protein
MMRRRPFGIALAVMALGAGVGVISSSSTAAAGAAVQAATGQRLSAIRTTTVSVRELGATSPGGTGGPERTPPKRRGSSPLRTDPAAEGTRVPAGAGTATTPAKRTKSNPSLVTDFESLNHRDSRLAFGGNQFSGEPPDQGLCVGNGYVLATVNSALQITDTAGNPAAPVVSLNEFYGFPPAINRTTGAFGPFTFDISCHYDPDTNRWFHLAVDLSQDPVTGDFTGGNYLDLAVSASGDPTGSWFIYRIPGMNDGTEGTPDHDCPGGPCFADFPHIGVDKNGVYITTNEFPLFADGFIGAQVYALSKAQLVAGAPSVTTVLFNTADDPVRPGEPGFTLWPALSAGMQFAGEQGGTQYFVSSDAIWDDANADSEEIIVWALSNTKSLNTANPSLVLRKRVIPSLRYAVPPPSPQKDGEIPYGELFEGATAPGVLDTSDSRVLDTRYANGMLWAVLGTSARAGASTVDRAGVAWFVIRPSVNANGLSATMVKQGILALEDEALSYPTIGVTTSGRGVIGFTRVSENLFPSAGYASIDALAGAGPVGMVEEGKSPTDGFTEYGGRPRWGDYGAAAVDGRNVWLANEYIEQPTCTVANFIATGGSCGGTRTTLANWSTRVSRFTT